jgi:glycosyltransferase involved in cell wall biosynthesis
MVNSFSSVAFSPAPSAWGPSLEMLDGFRHLNMTVRRVEDIRPDYNVEVTTRDPDEMDATIVICTFNRSGLLDKTLERLRCLDVSACADWEILVVNNNSTDDTDAVIRRHSEHLPIRRLWEPRPGKSRAANLAVSEAKGDLLLWTDDDVLVDPGWMNAHVQTADAHPEASFFGGPIAPWFECEPPAWIKTHLPSIETCFAIRNGFAQPLTPITEAFPPSKLPFGANMATRSDCLDGCPFDVRLGPQRDTEIRGEETALLQNWLNRGLTGLWVQGAKVQHFIPRERLTERFIWNYYCGSGRTEVRLSELPPSKAILGMPRWVVRKYVENLAVSKLLSRKKDDRWLRSLRSAAVCRGILKEYRDQRTSGSVPRG